VTIDVARWTAEDSEAPSQEREIIVVQALVSLGRRDEALARTQMFLDRYPDSAHARRLRTILGLPGPMEPTGGRRSSDKIIIPEGRDHGPNQNRSR
jgi:hypothetical protein